MSQMIVREAFKQLVVEGFLRAEPRRGVAVAELSRDEVLELTHIRALIEAQALEWSIPKMTTSDFDAASKVLRELDRLHDADDVIRLNEAFHKLLYAPAGCARTLGLIETLQKGFERYFRYICDKTGHVPKTQKEHHAILKLCKERNIRSATKLLKQHIIGAGQALTDHLDSPNESGMTSSTSTSNISTAR
jgi:DNA-binding GntR family transcriptional regulator